MAKSLINYPNNTVWVWSVTNSILITALWDFYVKVILPSVKYGLVLWGACCDSDLFQSIEWLHLRASRIIFNLPKDMASCDALGYNQWPTLFLCYKLDIFMLFHKAHNINDGLSELLSKDIYTKHCSGYYSRGKDCLLIPRFNTRHMKDLITLIEVLSYGTLLVLMNMEFQSQSRGK